MTSQLTAQQRLERAKQKMARRREQPEALRQRTIQVTQIKRKSLICLKTGSIIELEKDKNRGLS